MLVCAALLCLQGAARGGEPSPVVSTGFVLLSAPDGADVFLDERPVGRTPLAGPYPAPPGEHRVRVSRLGFAPYSEALRVYKGKVAGLLVEMIPIAGVLQLRVNVAGSRVFIDGKYAGDAPIELELVTGPHNVRVAHRGYREEIFSVSAAPGSTIDRDVQLVEMAAHQALQQQIEAPPARLSSRWWVWPIGVIAAGGIAAAVIVPTVYSSRSPCQRADAEICVPVHSALETRMLSLRLPF